MQVEGHNYQQQVIHNNVNNISRESIHSCG